MTTNTQIMTGVTSTASSSCFSGPSSRLCFMYLLERQERAGGRPAGRHRSRGPRATEMGKDEQGQPDTRGRDRLRDSLPGGDHHHLPRRPVPVPAHHVYLGSPPTEPVLPEVGLRSPGPSCGGLMGATLDPGPAPTPPPPFPGRPFPGWPGRGLPWTPPPGWARAGNPEGRTESWGAGSSGLSMGLLGVYSSCFPEGSLGVRTLVVTCPALGPPIQDARTRAGHSLPHVPTPGPVAPEGDGAHSHDEDDDHVVVQHGLLGGVQRRPYRPAESLPQGTQGN